MEKYSVQLSEDSYYFLKQINEKDERICRDNLKKLSLGPYPGRDSGDKEKLTVKGEEVYRLHIGRTYTAFYVIIEKEKVVRVLEILTIEKAHKKYRY